MVILAYVVVRSPNDNGRPDPRRPKIFKVIVKVIEPDELHERTGYSRPHCGPEGDRVCEVITNIKVC